MLVQSVATMSVRSRSPATIIEPRRLYDGLANAVVFVFMRNVAFHSNDVGRDLPYDLLQRIPSE